MTPRIGWRAVAAGAGLGLAVLVATMLVVQVIDGTVGIDSGSNWVFAFYAIALAGLGAAGWLAARLRPDAPLAHGVLAALGAYAVIAVFEVGLSVVADRGPEPVALAFNGLMAASAGILGTLVAERAPSHPTQ